MKMDWISWTREEKERGAVLIIVAAMIIVFLGLAALAIDTGYLYTARAQLRAAADAAALAGVTKLAINDNDGAVSEAEIYAEKNVVAGEHVQVDPNRDIELGHYDADTGEFTPDDNNPDAIRVTLRRTAADTNPISLFFGKALGIDSVDMTATSTAVLPKKAIMFVLDRSGSMDFDTDLTFQWLYGGWYHIQAGYYWFPSGKVYMEFDANGWAQYGWRYTALAGHAYYVCNSYRRVCFKGYIYGGDEYLGITWVPEGDIYIKPKYDKYGNEVRRMIAVVPDGKKHQPMGDLQDAAQGFLDRLDPVRDKAGLVSFSSLVRKDQELCLGEDNYQQVRNAVDAMIGYGATNIGDALRLAREELTSERAAGYARKVIILCSDGCPNQPCCEDGMTPSEYALHQAELARQNGIIIFSVSLGEGADRELMQEIASRTGGAEYYAESGEDLPPIFQQIFERIPPRLAS